MSSILDALKKLEKETSQQDYPIPHVGSGRKLITPKRAIWIVGVACLCIGAILAIAFFRSTPEKAPQPLAGNAAPAPKPEAVLDDRKTRLASVHKTASPLPAKSPDHNLATDEKKPKTKHTVDNKEAKPVSVDEKYETGEVITKKSRVVEPKKTQGEKQTAEKPVQEPEPQIPIEESVKPESTENTSVKTITQEKKPLPIERLEGVDLKIQAISWNETPEERLAVISNQVLREGDNVKGYQISRINPDDIVLRRGDKDYRLDFSSRGWP